MPIYEYEYVRDDGTHVVVEEMRKMADRHEPLEVVDSEDGNRYIGRLKMSAHANMHLTWDENVINSDLPPKHYSPEDVQRDQNARKGRKRDPKYDKSDSFTR